MKAIAYQRDRRVHADEPHSFRKNRPRKKQMANQAYRSRVRQLLATEVRSTDEAGEHLATDPVRRKRPSAVGGGWGTLPLGVSVQARINRRLHLEIWRLFATEYDSGVHRRSFAGLLEYMISKVVPVKGEGSWDKRLAWDFAALLAMGPLPCGNRSPMALSHYYFGWGDDRQSAGAWLAACLADEPDWEARLRDWVQLMASEPPKGGAGHALLQRPANERLRESSPVRWSR